MKLVEVYKIVLTSVCFHCHQLYCISLSRVILKKSEKNHLWTNLTVRHFYPTQRITCVLMVFLYEVKCTCLCKSSLTVLPFPHHWYNSVQYFMDMNMIVKLIKVSLYSANKARIDSSYNNWQLHMSHSITTFCSSVVL